MKPAKQIDVSQVEAYLNRVTKRLTEKVNVVLGDRVIAQLVPPSEIADEKRVEKLKRGQEAVQKARAYSESQGFSDDDIGCDVDAAVDQVRSAK